MRHLVDKYLPLVYKHVNRMFTDVLYELRTPEDAYMLAFELIQD